MKVRRLLVCALSVLSLTSCTVFDRERLLPLVDGSGGMGGSSGSDGGDLDGDLCVPKIEACNGVDDDCDGVDDLQDPDARAWCEPMIPNSEVLCASAGQGEVLCARLRCDPGFSSCDGDPSNGCEVASPSCDDEDAGDEDGGDEDGGS